MHNSCIQPTYQWFLGLMSFNRNCSGQTVSCSNLGLKTKLQRGDAQLAVAAHLLWAHTTLYTFLLYSYVSILQHVCRTTVVLLVASHVNQLNSLVPGRCSYNLNWIIFTLIWKIDIWIISCEIALRWISQELTADESILVQVMAWCQQATSHYLSQCWPRSLLPYGIIRPQWVKAEHFLRWSLLGA